MLLERQGTMMLCLRRQRRTASSRGWRIIRRLYTAPSTSSYTFTTGEIPSLFKGNATHNCRFPKVDLLPIDLVFEDPNSSLILSAVSGCRRCGSCRNLDRLRIDSDRIVQPGGKDWKRRLVVYLIATHWLMSLKR